MHRKYPRPSVANVTLLQLLTGAYAGPIVTNGGAGYGQPSEGGGSHDDGASLPARDPGALLGGPVQAGPISGGSIQ